MNTKRLITLLLLLASIIIVGTAQAQTPTPTAQKTLLTYYTDINLHDYANAYALWRNPPQSYQNFADGFTDTDHVTPYFGDLQPSGLAGQLGRVPVVLLGYNFHGEVASFFGCFTLAFDYRITGATIHQISTAGIPDAVSISSYMAIDCTHIPTSLPTTFLDSTDTNYGLMWSYFRAINQKDFTTAYNDWLFPIAGPKPNGQPATDYRQTFAAFSAGYADTTWIDTYPGVFDATGASAGHGYLSGLMPIVLVGQKIDGSVTGYSGCFVMGAFLNGLPGIVSGRFTQFVDDAPTGDQIVAAQNIDCTSLNLKY